MSKDESINTDNKQEQGAFIDIKAEADDIYSAFFENLNSISFQFKRKMDVLNEQLKFLVENKKDIIELAEIFLAVKRFQKGMEVPGKESNKHMGAISESLRDRFATSSLERVPLPGGTVFPKTKTTVKVVDEDKSIKWLQDLGLVEHVNARIEDQETIKRLVELGLEDSITYELADSFEKFMLERSNFDADLPDKDAVEVNDFTVISYRSK